MPLIHEDDPKKAVDTLSLVVLVLVVVVAFIKGC
jgi:hypothetical protein